MAEDGGHDNGLHATTAELGGDRVAHVMQPRAGMHPGSARQSLERASEGVRIQGETIAAITYHREWLALLVD